MRPFSKPLHWLATCSPLVKSAFVLGGYVIAFAVALAAVARRVANSDPDADASSGMYAFGDGILFLGLFGALATGPTAAGVYFLRSSRWFWSLSSTAVLLVASTGFAATFVSLASLGARREADLAALGALAELSLLAAPFLTIAFFLASVIAPVGSARRNLLIAAALEGVGGVYAVFQWFNPFRFM